MSVLVTELANGVLLPVVSLGAWQLAGDAPTTPESVRTALAVGYKSVDDAWVYGNEHVIGPIVAADQTSLSAPKLTDIKPCAHFKVVSEDEYLQNLKSTPSFAKITDDRRTFVTTKIWVAGFSPEGVQTELDEHLQHFSRSSADLVLLHWPGPHVGFGATQYTEEMQSDAVANKKRRIEVWRELEKHHHNGLIRAIGVSNFYPRHLEQIINDVLERKNKGDKLATLPMVNQIEISAFLPVQPAIQEICHKHNIQLTSYSSLGSAKCSAQNLANPLLTEIAAKYNVTPANVLLRWCMEKGYTVLPRSTKAERVKENYKVFHFALTKEDMERLATLGSSGVRAGLNPEDIA